MPAAWAGDIMPTAPQNLAQWLKTGAILLQAGGVEHPQLAAEHIAARRLAIPRLELALHRARALAASDLETMDADMRRLANQEPLQYVLGNADFMGHSLAVDRRALIPRPETEELVEHLFASADHQLGDGMAADVGTGSGAIGIALASRLPGRHMIASDISRDALAVAGANIAGAGLRNRVHLVAADLLAWCRGRALSCIAANLPYIPTGVWHGLPAHIREYEPRQALDGGADGLDFVRRLMPQAAKCLRPRGILGLEIDPSQAGAVKAALAEAFDEIRIIRDLSGRERIAIARRRGAK